MGIRTPPPPTLDQLETYLAQMIPAQVTQSCTVPERYALTLSAWLYSLGIDLLTEEPEPRPFTTLVISAIRKLDQKESRGYQVAQDFSTTVHTSVFPIAMTEALFLTGNPKIRKIVGQGVTLKEFNVVLFEAGSLTKLGTPKFVRRIGYQPYGTEDLWPLIYLDAPNQGHFGWTIQEYNVAHQKEPKISSITLNSTKEVLQFSVDHLHLREAFVKLRKHNPDISSKVAKLESRRSFLSLTRSLLNKANPAEKEAEKWLHLHVSSLQASAENTGCTPMEISAINFYTSGIDAYINGKMRSGDRSDIQGFYDLMEKCLRKLPEYRGYVFRGDKFLRASGGVENERLSMHKTTGKKVHQPSFVSTSFSENIAFQFGAWKDKNIILRYENHGGKDIRSFSNFPNEHEVLLLPGDFVVSNDSIEPKEPTPVQYFFFRRL